MDLDKPRNLDPNILLGIINDKLRHECMSIEDLLLEIELEREELDSILAGVGYHYNGSTNQYTSEPIS